MSTTSLQIGGNYGNGDEMVLLAQTGAGKWQHLGGTADPVDGRRELEQMLSEAGDTLETTYRWQTICAARGDTKEYMDGTLRVLTDMVISLRALAIMRQISNETDAALILSIEGQLEKELKPYEITTTETVPLEAKDFYQHLQRKYTEKWKSISSLIMKWANGECKTGNDIMVKLLGIDNAKIGCAADLSALVRRGAVRRETLGILIVKCTNGKCTRVKLTKEVAESMIREFRKKFYVQSGGRAAGIAHGGKYTKLPIIDLGYFTKERADLLTGDEDGSSAIDLAERDL